MSGSIAEPCRTASTPTPFGPPNLWALSDTRSTCGQISRRSSHDAACTASVWSNARGARSRTTAATAPRSVIDPTSLLTAITDTTATSSSMASRERVEVHPGQAVDRNDGPVVTLHGVEHRVVLARRAHGPTTRPPHRASDGGVVALGAAAREHDLAWLAADRRGDLIPRVVDRSPCLAGEAVGTTGVGEAIGEERQHRLDGDLPHRCRRRVIEIDERLHARQGYGLRRP